MKLLSYRPLTALALPACILSAGVFAAVACGSSDQPENTGTLPGRKKPATQTVTVTVNFPDDGVKNTTNSLHVWFIEKGDSGGNCADLVGGASDPNAGPLGHLGDVVSKDLDNPVKAEGVEVGGPTLAYVEAVDDNGQVEWAGCADVSKGSVTVTLDKARVYDCGAPGVKNGAPCDDGDACMIGESCKDGSCQGGKRRDCSDLNGTCSVGQCEADKGCVKVAFNDGGLCSDGLNCTTDDKCQNGTCVGTAKNCDTDSGGCRTGSVCDERLGGECTSGTILPSGTLCDDHKFCTTGDQCVSGTCVGTLMDCSASGGCTTCSETTHTCTDPAPSGTYCSDGKNCTSNDQCDGTGHCVGKPVDCSTYNSGGGCTVGVCDETFGSCTTTIALEGSLCDDGNACTTGDHCSSGSCTYTTTATDGTPCGAPCKIGATCSFGSCYGTTYASSLTPCNDGNSCSTSDMCDGYGYCYGGAYATQGTVCSMTACPNGAQCTLTGRCGCK